MIVPLVLVMRFCTGRVASISPMTLLMTVMAQSHFLYPGSSLQDQDSGKRDPDVNLLLLS